MIVFICMENPFKIPLISSTSDLWVMTTCTVLAAHLLRYHLHKTLATTKYHSIKNDMLIQRIFFLKWDSQHFDTHNLHGMMKQNILIKQIKTNSLFHWNIFSATSYHMDLACFFNTLLSLRPCPAALLQQWCWCACRRAGKRGNCRDWVTKPQPNQKVTTKMISGSKKHLLMKVKPNPFWQKKNNEKQWKTHFPRYP